MRLSEINHIKKSRPVRVQVIEEGYGRTFTVDPYTGDKVTDPKPTALSLGKFRSSRGNQLMSGINLNYLSDEQRKRLQQNLPSILRKPDGRPERNNRRRVRKLRAMMPDIFNQAYRTYNRAEMNNVQPGVLKFLKPEPGEVDQPPKPAPESDLPKPTDVDPASQPDVPTPDDLTPMPKPGVYPRQPVPPARSLNYSEHENREPLSAPDDPHT